MFERGEGTKTEEFDITSEKNIARGGVGDTH